MSPIILQDGDSSAEQQQDLPQETPADTLYTDIDTIKDDQASTLILEALTPPNPKDLLAFAENIDERKALETADYEEVFMTADKIAREYMLQQVIPGLDKVDQKNAQMVVETVNFGNVPKEKRRAFIQLAIVHQKISRILIEHVIKNTENKGNFSDLEIEELINGIKMADASDRIYKKWEFIDHDIKDPRDRKKAGFTSPWHIVKEGTEVPYKEIFTEEYDEILTAIDEHLNYLHALEKTQTDDKDVIESKIVLYEALKEAYFETEEEKLDKLWLKVGRAFVNQRGSLHAVHPMETNYGANITGIIPGQSLRHVMPNHPSNSLIEERKNQALAVLKQKFKDFPEAQDKVKIIERLNVLITHYAIRSGIELVFKMAGHNIPNEEETRIKDGVIIYMDPITMTERLEESKELFEKIFPPELHHLVNKLSPKETLAEMALHELGHNLFDPKAFETQHGGLEEWKGSALNHVLYTAEDENFSDEQLQKSFVSNLCQAMRYTQRGHEASQKPYYEASCALMKVAQEAGVIVKDDEGWTLDLSREKIQGYHKRVTAQWWDVLHIYKDIDQERRDQFIEENMGKNEFIRDVLKVIKKDASRS